ncbi:hypothetical protein [Amycolatopsis samaneae]|uniref:hypothetical protein n=1 Tax=Amycolatopsis samaneae TaxID=664691 RepID=UPI003610FF25
MVPGPLEGLPDVVHRAPGQRCEIGTAPGVEKALQSVEHRADLGAVVDVATADRGVEQAVRLGDVTPLSDRPQFE